MSVLIFDFCHYKGGPKVLGHPEFPVNPKISEKSEAGREKVLSARQISWH